MKNKKGLYVILAFVILSVLTACIVTIINTNYHQNSIYSVLSTIYGKENVKLSAENNGILEASIVLDHNSFAVEDYTKLRTVLTKLSKKNNDNTKVYSLTCTYYTPNKLSLVSATVLTEELFKTDWNTITNTKELFQKANMYTYEH